MNDKQTTTQQKQKSQTSKPAAVGTAAESDCLRQLLTAFDARALGEGDEVAGLNVLAAMAIILANIARPGSGICTPDGQLIRVGCNLLASGPLVTNMILDEVVTPVACCQNNLLAQLTRLLKAEKQQSRKPSPDRTMSEGDPSNPGENCLFQLMTAEGRVNPQIDSRRDQWLQVVSCAPSEHLGDLVQRPRSFIAAATPSLLEKQLSGIHSGQALVTIGLNCAADAGRFGDLCPALMDGMIPAGPSTETVKGKLLVIDRCDALSEAAKATDDKTAWLARLLWLVEGSAGPDLPRQQTGDGSIVRLPQLTARFEHAAGLILADRLDSHRPEPVIDKYDFAQIQTRWMTFLSGMEKSLPGISGTARHLLASLLFGLNRLVQAARTPKDFKYYIEGIEAFARFLIRRMANARAAILISDQQAWRLRYKRKILAKLPEGGLDDRSIYRLLHMAADNCRELLAELEADNFVKRRGNKWERIEGMTLPTSRAGQLQLEV